jgi:hypothetical protein
MYADTQIYSTIDTNGQTIFHQHLQCRWTASALLRTSCRKFAQIY